MRPTATNAAGAVASAGATAAFVAGCGAYGYARRRDLSSWALTLFWALLGLIALGIVAIFVSIPKSRQKIGEIAHPLPRDDTSS